LVVRFHSTYPGVTINFRFGNLPVAGFPVMRSLFVARRAASQKESSFSEQKEAKRLLSPVPAARC